jgi:dTDP-4-amino-4,6-dideoxygalactose transaminase
MATPFFDWRRLYEEHAAEYDQIFQRVGRAGAFILQRDVEELEERLADVIGVAHVVALSDATNAMTLGLRALGLKPGEEVIISSHTFQATAQSVHWAGGVAIPAETGEDGMMAVDALEALITPRTRVIMPTQVNGRVADMDAIAAIAERHGLLVAEDSAQALGAKYRGRGAGSFGAFGCFSFYPSKLLGCFGDGGALSTNDADLAAKVRSMRNHGANAAKMITEDCDIWGTNSRIDNLHAAILNHKLEHYFDADIARRRQIAAAYDAGLADVPGVRRPPPPDAPDDRFDAFQNYEILSDRRDDLKAHLAAHGIGSIVQWSGVPIHRMRGLGFHQSLPRTDAYFEQCLLLPMNHMLTDTEVDGIIAAVRSFHLGDAREPALVMAAAL